MRPHVLIVCAVLLRVLWSCGSSRGCYVAAHIGSAALRDQHCARREPWAPVALCSCSRGCTFPSGYSRRNGTRGMLRMAACLGHRCAAGDSMWSCADGLIAAGAAPLILGAHCPRLEEDPSTADLMKSAVGMVVNHATGNRPRRLLQWAPVLALCSAPAPRNAFLAAWAAPTPTSPSTGNLTLQG